MTVLNIRHRTTYRYREPVRLGPHRLMLRPRESRDVRLLSSTLEMTPAASVSWTNDVFGNAVATAGFAGLADGLPSKAGPRSSSAPRPGRCSTSPPRPSTTRSSIRARSGPISGRWRCRRPSMRRAGSPTGRGVSCAVPIPIRWRCSRTWWRVWRRGSATRAARKRAHRRHCRPSIAAGARAATSPCCSPRRRAAWASARVSSRAISTIRIAHRCRKDRGRKDRRWGGLDPCVGRDLPAGRGLDHLRSDQPAVGGYNLIPLAVGRVIAQVMPMTGTFLGMTDAYLGMSVDVEVTP